MKSRLKTNLYFGYKKSNSPDMGIDLKNGATCCKTINSKKIFFQWCYVKINVTNNEWNIDGINFKKKKLWNQSIDFKIINIKVLWYPTRDSIYTRRIKRCICYLPIGHVFKVCLENYLNLQFNMIRGNF